MVLDYDGFPNGSFFSATIENIMFSRGTDLSSNGNSSNGYFQPPGNEYSYGAQSGDANYVNLSLNGNDGVYEAVAQFHITAGELWLIALAKNSDNTDLSISAGKTAIEGGSGSGATSAVPEVSGHLALLALGSAGVLTRRRLKRAA